MIQDCSLRFDFKLTFERAAEAMGRKCNRQSVVALLTVLFVASAIALNMKTMYWAYAGAETSVLDTVKFINNETPPGSLIETDEMGLFFLLNRPYHYPPSPLEIEFIGRTFLLEKVSVDYNPMRVRPDYLVVGPAGELRRLYDPILKAGLSKLIKTYGPYDIYRRSGE